LPPERPRSAPTRQSPRPSPTAPTPPHPGRNRATPATPPPPRSTPPVPICGAARTRRPSALVPEIQGPHEDFPGATGQSRSTCLHAPSEPTQQEREIQRVLPARPPRFEKSEPTRTAVAAQPEKPLQRRPKQRAGSSRRLTDFSQFGKPFPNQRESRPGSLPTQKEGRQPKPPPMVLYGCRVRS